MDDYTEPGSAPGDSVANSGMMSPDGNGGDIPEYRISHLMDDVADAFADRDVVQMVAPLGRGGIKPRTNNRVSFRVASSEDTDTRQENIRLTEEILETDGFQWTRGEQAREFIILGREIHDLRELRKDDPIHINTRRGPFKVFRVMDHAPEVLQRSDPAVTVELSNLDTDTDWMVVHWKNESLPWAYVRTYYKRAKGNYRYRKVEKVEWTGRIGPYRLYAPSHDDVREGYESDAHNCVQNADDNGWLGELHPSDVDRVLNLFQKPAAEVFAPGDVETVREVLESTADAFERQGNAMAMEAGDDEELKALAADNQSRASEIRDMASAFKLNRMDAVADGEDTGLYRCEDCGKAFTDRFKYPTHRRECPASGNGEELENEQTDNGESKQ